MKLFGERNKNDWPTFVRNIIVTGGNLNKIKKLFKSSEVWFKDDKIWIKCSRGKRINIE